MMLLFGSIDKQSRFIDSLEDITVDVDKSVKENYIKQELTVPGILAFWCVHRDRIQFLLEVDMILRHIP